MYFMKKVYYKCGIALSCTTMSVFSMEETKQPNILFVFSDDHAVKAVGAYGSELTKLAPTPNIDRIANEGALFKNNFCANSICGPSRACVLTGKHSHINGFTTNHKKFDGEQQTFPKLLQKAGYRTAIFGKWHLKSNPTGFDKWMVYPGQGSYYNPGYLTQKGRKQIPGYSVEVTTDLTLDFIKEHKDTDKPFMVMCQYKAPHRNWMPGPKYLNKFDDVTFPEPDTLFDDYKNRTSSAAKHKMGIDEHMSMFYDLKVEAQPGQYKGSMERFLKRMTKEQRAVWDKAYAEKNAKFIAANLTGKDLVRWKYQRYIKDYLRCVAAVDDNIGRLLDYLAETGLDKNTIVVYSSDQGFYLGEHGWFDKRWMYEESMREPLVMRWPEMITPGMKITQLTQNIDFAPTFIEAAGVVVPEDIQGKSLMPLFKQDNPTWRKSVYYHYYEGGGHGVATHYGVRGERYKLIFFDRPREWELYDLKVDPSEMNNVYGSPEMESVVKKMKAELEKLSLQYKVKKK